MKVKDLIKELQKLNPEALVMLQSDPEGNSYSRMAGVAAGIVNKDEDTVYNDDSSASDNCLEEDEWKALKAKPSAQCAIIWPLN